MTGAKASAVIRKKDGNIRSDSCGISAIDEAWKQVQARQSPLARVAEPPACRISNGDRLAFVAVQNAELARMFVSVFAQTIQLA
eukprot:6206992-Pleurochrysis_carterae.AAC.2